jgi:hypothetical protein
MYSTVQLFDVFRVCIVLAVARRCAVLSPTGAAPSRARAAPGEDPCH